MSEADIQCSRCLGTGLEEVGEPPVQQACSSCGGDGYKEKNKIDTTAIMSELDYIHGKVTAIWNKVNNL